MTDFHSHILPGIDDGSQSVEESIQMLSSLYEQGVKTVCATPHFYADENTPSRFFRKRQEAYERLCEALAGKEHPEILLGAELAYFTGISKMSKLDQFKIQGTDLLLIEMPMAKWSNYAVKELIDISSGGDKTIVIAHIERYFSFQKKSVWRDLLDSGIVMQSNASNFVSLKTRRKAISQFKRGEIHLLGSDCHNMTDRAPQMGDALRIIKNKLGNEAIQYFEHSDEVLIRNAHNNEKTEKILLH
jgi:protein-tyrosine phosphatase